MKFIRNMFMVALLAALPLIAFAATKSVDLDQTVAVGNTVLKPGTYHVTWSGNGPNVQVEFKSGKKTVATTTATVQNQKAASQAVEVGPANGNNAKTLQAIDFTSERLAFGGSATGAGQ